MPITIRFDPIQTVIDVFKQLYQDHSATIIFGAELPEKGCGLTIFNDGEIPEINISADLPYLHCAEILAHELAHVVAGKRGKHGKKWEAVFEALHKGYLSKLEMVD